MDNLFHEGLTRFGGYDIKKGLRLKEGIIKVLRHFVSGVM